MKETKFGSEKSALDTKVSSLEKQLEVLQREVSESKNLKKELEEQVHNIFFYCSSLRPNLLLISNNIFLS